MATDPIRSAGLMAGGAVMAQAVPLAMMPIISRVYTPADFGTFATIVAISTVLTPVATARYELAIILPTEDYRAEALAGLAMVIAASVAIVVSLLFYFVFPWLGILSGLEKVSRWFFFVPLLIFFTAFGQVGSYLATRQGTFFRIASAGVIQQLVNAAGALIFAGSSAAGLITGRSLGLFAFASLFAKDLARVVSGFGDRWSVKDMLEGARTYRQFPKYNLPYSLIGSFSRDFLVFALTASRGLLEAGHFGLARMIVTAPISLLSASLSQVYYKEASTRLGTPDFCRLTYGLLLGIALVFAPACALLTTWAPDVFAVIFGERWREAGGFAAILVVPAALSALSGWPERVFEVRAKRHWALAIQFGFDAVTITSVLVALQYGVSTLRVITVYATIQCLFHLVYLATIFKLASLRAEQYKKLVMLVFGIFVIVRLIEVWLSSYNLIPLSAFALHVAFAGSISLSGLYFLKQRLSGGLTP